jgi:glycosyltransferase involved in cell wall biosynthesis
MFVTQTHSIWGGIQWWIHHLSHRMLNRGWEVYAGLAQGAHFSDPHAYAAAYPHLKPVIMDARVGTESARIRAILRALRQVQPDVVIPIGASATFEAMRAFDATLIAPVLSAHEGVLMNVLAFRDVIDVAVPNSRLLERFLLRELDPAHVRYVRQGTPHAKVPRSARTSRLRAGVVSRLDETSKRVLDLPKVAAQIGDEIELHVFGDGPDRGALEKALGSRATMHGFMPTEQLYREAYPNLDVVLLFSSTGEGSPNVLYEAMQNGVVPVSSRFVGYASEKILLNGVNALMFEPGDTATAARHLTVLAADRPQLERLSAAAYEANASFTDEDMYDGWVDVIETTPHRPRPLGLRPLPPAGRLERAGVPAAAADFLRHIFGSRFPHKSGWEEWPGSQPMSTEHVQELLAQIDRSARDE